MIWLNVPMGNQPLKGIYREYVFFFWCPFKHIQVFHGVFKAVFSGQKKIRPHVVLPKPGMMLRSRGIIPK